MLESMKATVLKEIVPVITQKHTHTHTKYSDGARNAQ